MKLLGDLKNEIVNYYDFDEIQREVIIAKLVEIVGVSDKNTLIKEIRTDYAQSNESGISIIYEAVTHHAEAWGDFIIEEYKRAFELAKKDSSKINILGCLDELGFVKNKNSELGRKVVTVLENNISDSNFAIRHRAINFIGDWIEEENKGKYQPTIIKVQEKLKDVNWKVRHIAELVLSDISALPTGFSRPLIDKLRVYFGKPFDLN
jgi:ribosomal protein S24E